MASGNANRSPEREGSPPPGPPTPPDDYEIRGHHGYCGSANYAALFYDNTNAQGPEFAKNARACYDKCMSDDQCLAMEMKAWMCEFHNRGVSLDARDYDMPWPADNVPDTVSCWMKQPPGCNRVCDLTPPVDVRSWFVMPTATFTLLLMTCVCVRRCRRGRNSRAPAPAPEPEAWEPPSLTLPTRIVPPRAPEAWVEGGSSKGAARAAATATADESSRSSEDGPECAICLSEMVPGDVVMR